MTSLIRESILMFIGRGGVKLINFSLVFILVALFSASEVGQYGFLISTIFVTTIFSSFGTRYSIVKSKYSDRQLAETLNSLSIPLGILNFTILFVVYFYMEDGGFSSILWLIFAALAYMYLYMQQGVSLLRGSVLEFNFIEVLPKLYFLMLLLLNYSLDVNRFSIVDVILQAYFLSMISIYIWRGCFSFNFNLKDFFEFSATGLTYGVAIGLILLNSRVPIYVAQYYQGDAMVGNVFTAMRLADVALEVATAAGLVIFTNVSKFSKVDKKTYFVILIVMLFSVSSSLFFFYFGDHVISFISRGELLHAGAMLAIVSLGMPFSAINKMAYGVFSGLGRPVVGAYTYGLCIPFNVALAFLFVSNEVEYGFMYSLVISQVFASIIFGLFFLKYRRDYESSEG